MVSPATLAKIHIAKSQLGLDEEAYRAMLQSVGGVVSAKDLTPLGAAKVLAHLEKCGFRPSKQFGRRPSVGGGRKALVGKIEALLAERKLPWEYADGIVRRMFSPVKKVQFCDEQQLRAVITALVKQGRREAP